MRICVRVYKKEKTQNNQISTCWIHLAIIGITCMRDAFDLYRVTFCVHTHRTIRSVSKHYDYLLRVNFFLPVMQLAWGELILCRHQFHSMASQLSMFLLLAFGYESMHACDGVQITNCNRGRHFLLTGLFWYVIFSHASTYSTVMALFYFRFFLSLNAWKSLVFLLLLFL